jgi:NADH-quinone oxidoreductase subunit F
VEPVLTRNIAPGRAPLSLREYEQAGGYAALRQAMRLGPEETRRLVEAADLRGRGGAGYPAGKKWAALPPYEQSPQPRLIFVNCDEMEPGTFKDRYLVEGDPHQVLEGTILAAYACRITRGYIFVRAEYVEPYRVLEGALAEAREAGYLGRNLLGSGWDFDLHLHASAGRYMCGEALALLNAMEGGRALPRTKPPYAANSGAWGKPSIVNNVETLCCVPHIIARGPEWFRDLGKATDAGTKVYGISGRVKRPGSYELPMGTTLRELLEVAGGMQEGYAFRAALPGGASSMFLEDLEVPLEFEALKRIGVYFGTGSAVILDDQTCPVAMTHNLQRFFARESCGWCTPCREGLPWLEQILSDLEQGRGRPGDLELLEELAGQIHGNTFCTLALGAVVSLESGLRKFRADYEAHVRLGRCPYRT